MSGYTRLGPLDPRVGDTGNNTEIILAYIHDKIGNTFGTTGILSTADNKNEDAQHSSGAVGSFVLAVRNDNLATTFTNGTGDYSPIAVGNLGELFTRNVPGAASVLAPTSYRKYGLVDTVEAVKAGAGNLYGWNIINRNAYAVTVKFYDETAASVVVGTTTPVKTLIVPGRGYFYQEANAVQQAFGTAISVNALGGFNSWQDSYTTAPAANTVIVELLYK